MLAGSRCVAYKNAPRSSSSAPANGCNEDSIAMCDDSKILNFVSPRDRSRVE
jgi:hypothetical protein